MKRTRGMAWTAALLHAVFGTALADRTIDTTSQRSERRPPGDIPPGCEQYRDVPKDSRSLTFPWEQQLSLATCRQVFTVEPTDDPATYRQLVATIDRALAPSIASYQDALDHGATPQIRILAAYELGLTHVDAIVRARAAVHVVDRSGAYGGATYGMRLDAYQRLHQPLEPLLVPHQNAGRRAFDEVARLAAAYPTEALANRLMTHLVADARAQRDALGWPETPTGVTQR